jgi:DNA-binding CsgD family transcriptional regulator
MTLDLDRKYVLLLADVTASSRLKPASREEIFAHLRKTNGMLNRKFRDHLVIKLSISYGDEIAALFSQCKYAYPVIDRLREAASPETTLRFVVVKDRIGIDSEDIRQLGGPVFGEANRRMNLIKTKNRFCSWALGNEPLDEILDSLTEMSNLLIESMTAYQRQVWQLLKSGHSQKQIAEKLGKFPQSVSEALSRGAGELVIDAEQRILHLLEQIDNRNSSIDFS